MAASGLLIGRAGLIQVLGVMDELNDRSPTAEARRNLASRFGLPYFDDMQDWEWEVATPERFEEFLNVYAAEILTPAERTSLMEVLFQCVEDTHPTTQMDDRWSELVPHLVANRELHKQTIEYWSCPGATAAEECFRVTPSVRSLHPASPERE
jgi:hypothetical protein